MHSHRDSWLRIAALAAVLLFSQGIAHAASAGAAKSEICDVEADYALGVENYPEAIRLHSELVRKHPEKALAHYHLGFARGMAGNRGAELREYKVAAELGLRIWDLFLNLGLVQLEDGELNAATDSLQRAVALGRNHSESHYNLALAYERRGILAEAEHEVLASLRLDPGLSDAQNMLGVIYAEEGKPVRALQVWRELLCETPDYEPARANLAVLGKLEGVSKLWRCRSIPSPAAKKHIDGKLHQRFESICKPLLL
jgi:tetratricopeptide (TPR) repeat protein